MARLTRKEIAVFRRYYLGLYNSGSIHERELEWTLLEQNYFNSLKDCQYWLRHHCSKYLEWYEKKRDEQLYSTRNIPKLSPLTNYSRRELSRRALIVRYNNFELTEKELTERLIPLFQAGDHPLNASTVTTVLTFRLWIAQRSRRYVEYLKENFPTVLLELKHTRDRELGYGSSKETFKLRQALASQRDVVSLSDIQSVKDSLPKIEKSNQS
jgi:hypothetical protein